MADPVRIISADSHVDIQQDRVFANLSEKYQQAYKDSQQRMLLKMMEQKPHKFRQQADGQETETAAPAFRPLMEAGEPWEAFGRPGAHDPVARLADMDIDQVEAEVLYTDISAGAGFYEVDDPACTLALFQAFNSAAVEFASHDPKRLLPVYLVPIHDIPAAVKEVERLAEEGARALHVPLYPYDIGFAPYWDTVYDPLWSTISERGLAISQHVGGHSALMQIAAIDPTPAKGIMQSLPPIFMSEALAGWTVSGVLERHPGLKIVLVEAGLGWIPYMLDRLDRMRHRHGWDKFGDMPISELPSFYWYRNMAATFEEDELGVELRDRIGVENLMWATDYPHPDSTWPESQKVIHDHFEGIDVDVIRAIVGGNAASVYGL